MGDGMQERLCLDEGGLGVSAAGRGAYSFSVRLTGVAIFALSAGWAAAVRIYLPGNPVPITLQTLPVLLAGGVMGYELGAASMLIYVLLGCAGMPFFSGMRSGLGVAFGPTGGYLVGFMAAAWVVGRMAHTARPSWRRLVAACAAGSAVIYACGVVGLLVTLPGTGLLGVLQKGVFPFLPGDLMKAAVAVGVLGFSGRWRRRFFPAGEE
jgi:biotin transport system substrate-specific component